MMIIAMKRELTKNNTALKNPIQYFSACAGEPSKDVSLHPRMAEFNNSVNKINAFSAIDLAGKSLHKVYDFNYFLSYANALNLFVDYHLLFGK
jgi:hypothetical protein